jgi:signal transduction histidine kinase
MATNRIARSILSAMDTDNLLVVLLDATADYLQVSHVSCVVFDSAAEGQLRSHVIGFGRDPVLGLRPAAAARFLELLQSSDGPIPFQKDRNGDLLAELCQVDRRVSHAVFQPIKGNSGKPGGWVGVYGTAAEAHVGTQGLLFLSSISRFAALGLEKIANFGALGAERDRLREELTDRNGKLEMAQARVRALNRGLESRVSERTRVLEEANRALKERSARAAQIARMRGMGKVAAAFAHEINNPLSGLASNLQYMQDNLDELRGWVAAEAPGDGKGLEGLAEFDAVIEECRESAERIRGVIASLKRFGTEEEAPETLVLNAAVADAVTLLEERIRSAADLEVHLGTLPEIRGDSLELNHVVLALLTNAVEAIERTGKRGRISITTFATNGRVTLLLKDSGAGIEAEQLEKIFDPFFTTKEGEPGAGLGLHCAHQTVQRHGGTMRVRSVPGEGTKVTVEIPVEEGATAETEPADPVRAE